MLICLTAILAAEQPKPWTENLPTVWGPVTNGWQAAIFSQKQGYLATEPLWMKLLARNQSGKTLKVHVGGPDWMIMAEFKVVRVTNGQLMAVRPHRNERERLERHAGYMRSGQIAPQGLVSPGFVDLQKMFDLTPGTYYVSATCQLSSPDAPNKTVSVPTNEITISVVAH